MYQKENSPLHGTMSPHCGYCQYFESCFLSDYATEWGYCSHEAQGKIPPEDDIERVKREAASGDYRSLLDQADRLGFFVAVETKCRFFSDFFPV